VTTAPRRMRSRTVLLGITAIAAQTLSGCAASEPDYAAICTDPQTHERVDDSQCDDSDAPRDYSPGLGGFFWFYMLTSGGYRLPAIGQTYSTRAGTYDGRGLVRSGRVVQRGGMPRAGASTVKSFTRSGGFGSSRGVSSS
jgi:hypothetical protein